MQFEYVSWAGFYRCCGILHRHIEVSGYRPDLIVAIARGGYPAARVLADYFGIMDLFSLKIEHYHGPVKLSAARVRYPLPIDMNNKRVLLVDDVSDSGDTFWVAIEHIVKRGDPDDLRTAVLHYKIGSTIKPDYHAHRVIKWRWITYPWAVVEDLSVLAARMTTPAETSEQLGKRLRDELGFPLPCGLWAQIGSVVMTRAAELRSKAPSSND
jgi:hypoxanthine phosphoribosyltransferase